MAPVKKSTVLGQFAVEFSEPGQQARRRVVPQDCRGAGPARGSTIPDTR